MDQLGILICALGPSGVLLLYGVAKAEIRLNNPAVWAAVLAGGVAAMMVVSPEMLLKQSFPIDGLPAAQGAAARAFFIAALPEEIAKFIATFMILRRCDLTDVGAPIAMSFATALGFAAVENLHYLMAYGNWPLLAVGRAVSAVPIHGLNGLAMGSLWTMARLRPRQRLVWLGAALVVPVLLHASYDFPLMLIERHEGFIGVLPAWFLMLVLSTIYILYLCHRVRASRLRRCAPINRIQNA